MAIDEQLGARLAAYLDGEADEAEQGAVEAIIAADPEARGALDEMRAARDLIRRYDTRTDATTADTSLVPLLAGVHVDHFLVEERIGIGGMGEVYRAVDTSLGRPVAIKVISPRVAADPHLVQRFVREARLQARIDHPHVAHVYHVGRHERRHYFVLEYLPGGSLQDRLREVGRLDPEEAVEVILEVADILKSCRRLGIVHRDLKPSNIMFTGDGSIKLTDFGIAKPTGEDATHLTESGAVVGTPRYLSPEAAAGGEITWRSDVYSLGCTLYRLLFGRPPYAQKGAVQLAVAHIREPFPEPDNLPPGVGQELMDVLRRMMAKEPGERFDDYESLASALSAARPKLVRPIGPWRRLGVGLVDALVTGGVFLMLVIMTAGVLQFLKPGQGAVEKMMPFLLSLAAVACHGIVPAFSGSTLVQGMFSMKVRPERLRSRSRWLLLWRGIVASPLATVGLAALALMLVRAEPPRELLGFLAALGLLGWYLADAVTMFRDERRRPLHDILFGTRLQHVTYEA